MRQHFIGFILGAVLIAAIFFGVSGYTQYKQGEQLAEAAMAYTPPSSETIVKPALTVETLYEIVKPCAKLVSATDKYVNTDSIRDHAKPLGIDLDYRFFRDEVQFSYRGSICFGIDLSDVLFDVNQESRMIYITLPTPTIVSHEIDTSSFIFDKKHDSWFAEIELDEFVARANSLKHEQEVRSIASGDAILEASRNAETTLTNLLTGASVTDGFRLRYFTKA